MPFERYEGIREMLCVIRRPILLSYYIVHTWSLIRNKAIILLLGSMWLKSQIKNKYKAQEVYTKNKPIDALETDNQINFSKYKKLSWNNQYKLLSIILIEWINGMLNWNVADEKDTNIPKLMIRGFFEEE